MNFYQNNYYFTAHDPPGGQLCSPRLCVPFCPKLHQSVFVSFAMPVLQLFVEQHVVTAL